MKTASHMDRGNGNYLQFLEALMPLQPAAQLPRRPGHFSLIEGTDGACQVRISYTTVIKTFATI